MGAKLVGSSHTEKKRTHQSSLGGTGRQRHSYERLKEGMTEALEVEVRYEKTSLVRYRHGTRDC